jgi:hypothetical protein
MRDVLGEAELESAIDPVRALQHPPGSVSIDREVVFAAGLFLRLAPAGDFLDRRECPRV